jgi:hypothetical protein
MVEAFVETCRLARRFVGGFAAVAATCALGACSLPDMVFQPPPVDLTSPVAKEVAEASRANSPYPRFRDMPEAPKDIRPVSAWTHNVYNVLRLRRQMQAMAELYPQTLHDTDAFAVAERAKVEMPVSPAAAAAKATETAHFAASQRERAKAPSPTQ